MHGSELLDAADSTATDEIRAARDITPARKRRKILGIRSPGIILPPVQNMILLDNGESALGLIVAGACHRARVGEPVATTLVVPDQNYSHICCVGSREHPYDGGNRTEVANLQRLINSLSALRNTR